MLIQLILRGKSRLKCCTYLEHGKMIKQSPSDISCLVGQPDSNRQACSSHCNLDSRIGRRQCCLDSRNNMSGVKRDMNER